MTNSLKEKSQFKKIGSTHRNLEYEEDDQEFKDKITVILSLKI